MFYDPLVSDIVIAFTGVAVGAGLTVLIGLKIVSMAVEKIIRRMIQNGYFFYEGRCYYVRPQQEEPTDG